MADTPHSLGYRWPAEWEPHEATWLSWPHARETWPGRLAAAEDAFVVMVNALYGRELVRINVQDAAMAERIQSRLAAVGITSGFECHIHPTDDAWVRDHGPVFLSGPGGEPALVDFGFDAWGGKYPPWDRDDAIPARIAESCGVRRFAADFVLEGGSVDGDGAGTVLTTESCLLNPNRRREGEPERTRAGMEARLGETLGARKVLWLGDGIEGDDTDGHVDDIARFVAPGVVVAAEEPDASDPNHAPLAENLRRLAEMTDADDRPLEIVRLPMPPPVSASGARCPASYANFYLANGVVLVPVFGVPEDDRALALLGEVLPGRDPIPIPARDLVRGLGAVHCLTQQVPAPAPAPA